MQGRHALNEFVGRQSHVTGVLKTVKGIVPVQTSNGRHVVAQLGLHLGTQQQNLLVVVVFVVHQQRHDLVGREPGKGNDVHHLRRRHNGRVGRLQMLMGIPVRHGRKGVQEPSRFPTGRRGTQHIRYAIHTQIVVGVAVGHNLGQDRQQDVRVPVNETVVLGRALLVALCRSHIVAVAAAGVGIVVVVFFLLLVPNHAGVTERLQTALWRQGRR